MKRAFVIFCVFALCSLCLLMNTIAVNAAAAGYSHMTYFLANPVTLDGNWTNAAEWTDTGSTSFGNTSTQSIFRSKWGATSDFSVISQYILVEFLSDTTNDPSDYWQFCFDGDTSGGTAPASGDIRIDINGHTTLAAYGGSGTGWTSTASPASFTWSNKFTATPTSSTPHWVLEVIIDKITFGIGANYWLRIACYDASNAAAGVQAWPPTSRDVPNDWGDIPYTMDPIPESLSLGVVVLLSSAALIVGSVYLRKRPKTTILTPTIL